MSNTDEPAGRTFALGYDPDNPPLALLIQRQVDARRTRTGEDPGTGWKLRKAARILAEAAQVLAGNHRSL